MLDGLRAALPSSRSLAFCCVVMLCCGLWRSVACAQDAGTEKSLAALPLLFELGLPDTKTAKWVRAEGALAAPELFGEDSWGGGQSAGGNAWVLSEQNGEVELLTLTGRRTRVAAVKEGGELRDSAAKLPAAMIKPADWKKDATAFLGPDIGARLPGPGSEGARGSWIALCGARASPR
jgi:hypothetical protein